MIRSPAGTPASPRTRDSWAVLETLCRQAPPRVATDAWRLGAEAFRALGLDALASWATDPSCVPQPSIDGAQLDERLRLAIERLDVRLDASESAEALDLGEMVAHVSGDGEVVLAPRAPTGFDDLGWVGSLERRAPMVAAVGPLPTGAGAPLVIAGFASPWLLDVCLERLREAEGASPLARRRLIVVEPDLRRAALALAATRLHEVRDHRAVLFVGRNAVKRFETWVAGRIEVVTPLRVDSADSNTTVGSLASSIDATIQRLCARQLQEHESARRACRALVEARGVAGYADRIARGAEGGPSLRVLLLSSCQTTFIRHSLGDLAAAFEALGHETQTLMEPDDTALLTGLGVSRATAEFDPDLIVKPNFTRAAKRGALPEGVPYACWMQDTLANAMGEAHPIRVPGDTLLGYAPGGDLRRFGFEASDWLPWPVPVSPDRFEGVTPSAAQRERFGCDIAFVSHHSESPTAMCQRLAAQLEGAPRPEVLVKSVRASLETRIADRWFRPFRDLRLLTREVLESHVGRTPPDPTVDVLLRGVTEPLAGRLYRWQTIGWAIEIAERHGLRFKLFGRGWEAQPEFAAHAAGPVEHGASLAACYQCAGLHLHADLQ
ncbi:MAG: hypothetical protein AAGK04_01770, partial [Planctomycetota bacterium]